MLQPEQDLLDEVRGLFLSEALPLRDVVEELAAPEQLEHEDDVLPALVDLVQVDAVLVLHLRQDVVFDE